MSDKPISDLRRRMIADMTVRSFRFLLPGAPSLVATTVRLHNRSAGNVISARIVNGCVEDAMRRTKAASVFPHSPLSITGNEGD